MYKTTTHYVGLNDLTYLTPEDAQLYGGGLKGKIIQTAPEFQAVKTEIEKPAEAEIAKAEEIQKSVAELNPTRDELLAKAKELGVKGAHLMGEEKLKEKIAIALAK